MKKEIKSENSRVERITNMANANKCPFCPFHKGCNQTRYSSPRHQSWKSHRKNQWRNKQV